MSLALSTLLLSTGWAGWSVAPMPIADYSTDHGVGYGGLVLAVRRLEGDEAYRLKLSSQLFWSTGTFRDHWVRADWNPEAPWQVSGVAGRRAWDLAPYYGVGAQPLLTDASAEYYTHAVDGARALVSVSRELTGPLSVFSTGFLRTATVTAPEGSLLVADGYDEGRYVALGLGLLVDTRDEVSSPKRGHLAEVSVRGAHPVVGSQFTGGGVNLTERVFLPLTAPAATSSAQPPAPSIRWRCSWMTCSGWTARRCACWASSSRARSPGTCSSSAHTGTTRCPRRTPSKSCSTSWPRTPMWR